MTLHTFGAICLALGIAFAAAAIHAFADAKRTNDALNQDACATDCDSGLDHFHDNAGAA